MKPFVLRLGVHPCPLQCYVSKWPIGAAFGIRSFDKIELSAVNVRGDNRGPRRPHVQTHSPECTHGLIGRPDIGPAPYTCNSKVYEDYVVCAKTVVWGICLQIEAPCTQKEGGSGTAGSPAKAVPATRTALPDPQPSTLNSLRVPMLNTHLAMSITHTTHHTQHRVHLYIKLAMYDLTHVV